VSPVLYTVHAASGERLGTYPDSGEAARAMQSGGPGAHVVRDGAVLRFHPRTSPAQTKAVERLLRAKTHPALSAPAVGSAPEAPREPPFGFDPEPEPTPTPAPVEAPAPAPPAEPQPAATREEESVPTKSSSPKCRDPENEGCKEPARTSADPDLDGLCKRHRSRFEGGEGLAR
jgi:hypothetical protein